MVESYTKEPHRATPQDAPRGISYAKPIAAAKEKVPVLELAEHICGEATPRGKELFFLCPLHDDHDPSLRVNPEKNAWYCDPCGEGGNVVRLAMRAWDHTDDDQGAATAAAMLLMELGHEPPQHPPSWFDKQERQAHVREFIHQAKVDVLARRLWRAFLGPLVAQIEDPEDRLEESERLWQATKIHARKMIVEREDS